MKLLHKNKNLTKEKKESMDKKNKKTKLRTIKDIKETIILKNKLIINHDSKIFNVKVPGSIDKISLYTL